MLVVVHWNVCILNLQLVLRTLLMSSGGMANQKCFAEQSGLPVKLFWVQPLPASVWFINSPLPVKVTDVPRCSFFQQSSLYLFWIFFSQRGNFISIFKDVWNFMYLFSWNLTTFIVKINSFVEEEKCWWLWNVKFFCREEPH